MNLKLFKQSPHSFSREVGIDNETVSRWTESVPQHAIAYLKICVVLDCTPPDLIESGLLALCRVRSLDPSYVSSVCGFDPFTFYKETKGGRMPCVLKKLSKIYIAKGSLQPWIDVSGLRESMLIELKNIEAAIAS